MNTTRLLLTILMSLVFRFNGFAQERGHAWYGEKLIEIKKEDQELRKAFGKALKTGKPTDSLKQKMAFTDRIHTQQLKSLVKEFGFPNATDVGMDATHSFWVLMMHQDSDTLFQKQALVWMREAVKRKDAFIRDLPYLEDRVAVNAGKCQKYGTQVDYDEETRQYFSFPICDLKKVKRLRKKMKLMSLEEQLRRENLSLR